MDLWNSKCNICGSNAYAGLFGTTDCENTRCKNHKGLVVSNNSHTIPIVNSSIKEEEEYAKEILLILSMFMGKECFLIGGALREWYFNRNAKDLDFFVNCDNLCNFEQFLKSCNFQHKIIDYKRLSSTPNTPNNISNTPNNTFNIIQMINSYEMFIDVYELNVENKLQCQIIDISTNKIDEILNTFDFNLNKCFISSNDICKRIYTKEFVDDVNSKNMTLNLSTMMDNKQYSSIKKLPPRIERMQSLFQDFKLKVT